MGSSHRLRLITPCRFPCHSWKSQLAKLATNPRAVAVSQLLRVEEEGAFVGLVGGSPGSDSDSPDESPDVSPNESTVQQPAGGGGSEQQGSGERNWRERLSDRCGASCCLGGGSWVLLGAAD